LLIDARDGAVAGIRHPDGACVGDDVGRHTPDGNAVQNPQAVRVDPKKLIVQLVCDPDPRRRDRGANGGSA